MYTYIYIYIGSHQLHEKFYLYIFQRKNGSKVAQPKCTQLRHFVPAHDCPAQWFHTGYISTVVILEKMVAKWLFAAHIRIYSKYTYIYIYIFIIHIVHVNIYTYKSISTVSLSLYIYICIQRKHLHLLLSIHRASCMYITISIICGLLSNVIKSNHCCPDFRSLNLSLTSLSQIARTPTSFRPPFPSASSAIVLIFIEHGKTQNRMN